MDDASDFKEAIVCCGDRSLAARYAWFLTDSDFVSVHISNGYADLLQRVSAGRPSVVVLELAVAGTVGVDAARQLRKLSPTTAVILTSNLTGLNEQAQLAGAVALLEHDDVISLRQCLAAVSQAPDVASALVGKDTTKAPLV